ncbi:AMP-binding protein [Pseudaminobacter sp. NGMCC 1.201702]
MNQDILAPLRNNARLSPDCIALRSHDKPDTSISGLLNIVDSAVCWMAEHGVTPQSRVATLLPNAPETAVAILAGAACATVVPMNPAYPPAETQRLLAEAGVTHLITHPSCIPGAISAAAGSSIRVLQLTSTASGLTGAFELACVDEGRTTGTAGPAEPASPRTVLVLHTSGSTGAPKRVPLTAENLSASAWNVARSLELQPTDICLHMMPMFHIGAVADLLLAPLYAGGSTAFVPAISSDAFFGGLRHFSPTWFQAVPTVLRDILAYAATAEDVENVRRLRFVRSVSQPLPDRLQKEFGLTFGTTLVPMFGMTETAGLITSTPLDRTREKRGSVGIPFGTNVKICDSFGNEVGPFKRGEVLVSGPNVMAGYEGQESAHSDAFIGKWLRSGDEGFFDDDGFLFLTGRLKDIINRGGEKISPLEIDLILAGHPAIREAAAFPLPHPSLGEEVAVAVVTAANSGLDARGVKDYLRGRVADFKIPRAVTFLDRLPRVPSGKLDRLALPGLAGATAGHASERRAPGTPLAKTLAALWQRTLKVPDIAMDDNFFDLGGDSLSATNLMLLLEERFGNDLPTALLFEQPTLREMEQVLDGRIGRARADDRLDPALYAAVKNATAAWRGKRQDNSLILGRNTLGVKRPFFWVCQSMWQFEMLSENLDPERPFHILSSLSNTRLKSDGNTNRLARYYAAEILSIQPQGPYLLGGFCQGGVVAFEIAKALRAMGREVALLCLQDRFIAEPYDGEVALFWGKRGWFCAYDLNDEPERGWAKYYSGPLSVFHSAADHDDLHKMPHVGTFARQLEAEFERIEAGLPPSYRRKFKALQPLNPKNFKSSVRVKVPLFMRQGSSHTIKVTVTNKSPLSWEPTEKSGIILASRWRSFDRLHGYALDARRPLTQEIRPSQSLTLDLRIKVPMRGLPMFLDVDLVEDGVHWFGGFGHSGTSKLVIPLAPDWPVSDPSAG